MSLRAHLDYAWNNADGWPAAARLARDELRPRCPAIVSTAPSGPTLGYAGLDPHQILPFLESRRDAPASSRRQAVLPWATALAAVGRSADLVFAGGPARRIAALRARAGHAGVLAPFRLHLVLDTDRPADTVLGEISRRERRYHAKLRRDHDWRWEHATAPADFRHFYRRMHRPLMERRHGSATRSIPEDVARDRLFAGGRLFFLRQAGERVVGVLCGWSERRRRLTMRLLGVLDGDERHYTSGAVKAVYFMAIGWACGNGVRTLDLSGTEPFLSKGILQFKRRLHPSVVPPPTHYAGRRLWLAAARDTPAVRDFLVANPFLALGPEPGPGALYPQDRDRPARTDISAALPGVAWQRRLDLDRLLPLPLPEEVFR